MFESKKELKNHINFLEDKIKKQESYEKSLRNCYDAIIDKLKEQIEEYETLYDELYIILKDKKKSSNDALKIIKKTKKIDELDANEFRILLYDKIPNTEVNIIFLNLFGQLFKKQNEVIKKVNKMYMEEE